MNNKTRDAIKSERKYQDEKWGPIDTRRHEVGAWILLMQSHIQRAANDWASSNRDENALAGIRKVLAIGVACGEQHDIPKRTAR